MKNLDLLNDFFENAAKTKAYRKGDQIFLKNEKMLSVYRVQKGRVKLWRDYKNKGLTFYLIHSGELFGLMDYFITSESRHYEASALDNDVVIEYISLTEFEELLINSPTLKFSIIKLLGRRLKKTWEKHLELRNNDLQQLILNALRKMGKETGVETKEGFLIKGISHQDLADFFGVSRQNVSTILSNFRRKGIIDYNRSQILVK